jgi:hypothetical protein
MQDYSGIVIVGAVRVGVKTLKYPGNNVRSFLSKVT